ncbi:MAG: hypothetical protein AAB931_00705 [Patescibacteria group bacterium]
MNFLHILHDKRTLSISLILFFLALIVYLLSYKGEGKNYNHFVLLADSFLHGRLYLTTNPPWLNELVNINNHFYVPFPPMPAIMLTPFVFLFGASFPQPILSILIAALNVPLCFIVILKFFKNEKLALWISLLYAFGTIQWYHAEVGSSWYIAHIIAMFFLWLSLLELETKRRFYLIGFFISLAFLSREPAIFALFFPLIYLFRKFNFQNLLKYGLGASIGVLISVLYNYLSFGAFYNLGYWLIPNVLNEPWYRFGIVSVNYIPTHLIELFTSLPKFIPTFPYVLPSLNVMAIWFTTPAFLLILKANFNKLLERASLITAIAILFPILIHGSNGFTQFGYRFILDLYPFLLILTASGINNSPKWFVIILIFISILINLWGVLMISFFNIWSL